MKSEGEYIFCYVHHTVCIIKIDERKKHNQTFVHTIKIHLNNIHLFSVSLYEHEVLVSRWLRLTVRCGMLVLSPADEQADWVAHLLMGEWHLLVAGLIIEEYPVFQTLLEEPKPNRPVSVSESLCWTLSRSLSTVSLLAEEKMKSEKPLSEKSGCKTSE